MALFDMAAFMASGANASVAERGGDTQSCASSVGSLSRLLASDAYNDVELEILSRGTKKQLVAALGVAEKRAPDMQLTIGLFYGALDAKFEELVDVEGTIYDPKVIPRDGNAEDPITVFDGLLIVARVFAKELAARQLPDTVVPAAREEVEPVTRVIIPSSRLNFDVGNGPGSNVGDEATVDTASAASASFVGTMAYLRSFWRSDASSSDDDDDDKSDDDTEGDDDHDEKSGSSRRHEAPQWLGFSPKERLLVVVLLAMFVSSALIVAVATCLRIEAEIDDASTGLKRHANGAEKLVQQVSVAANGYYHRLALDVASKYRDVVDAHADSLLARVDAHLSSAVVGGLSAALDEMRLHGATDVTRLKGVLQTIQRMSAFLQDVDLIVALLRRWPLRLSAPVDPEEAKSGDADNETARCSLVIVPGLPASRGNLTCFGPSDNPCNDVSLLSGVAATATTSSLLSSSAFPSVIGSGEDVPVQCRALGGSTAGSSSWRACISFLALGATGASALRGVSVCIAVPVRATRRARREVRSVVTAAQNLRNSFRLPQVSFGDCVGIAVVVVPPGGNAIATTEMLVLDPSHSLETNKSTRAALELTAVSARAAAAVGSSADVNVRVTTRTLVVEGQTTFVSVAHARLPSGLGVSLSAFCVVQLAVRGAVRRSLASLVPIGSPATVAIVFSHQHASEAGGATHVLGDCSALALHSYSSGRDVLPQSSGNSSSFTASSCLVDATVHPHYAFAAAGGRGANHFPSVYGGIVAAGGAHAARAAVGVITEIGDSRRAANHLVCEVLRTSTASFARSEVTAFSFERSGAGSAADVTAVCPTATPSATTAPPVAVDVLVRQAAQWRRSSHAYITAPSGGKGDGDVVEVVTRWVPALQMMLGFSAPVRTHSTPSAALSASAVVGLACFVSFVLTIGVLVALWVVFHTLLDKVEQEYMDCKHATSSEKESFLDLVKDMVPPFLLKRVGEGERLILESHSRLTFVVCDVVGTTEMFATMDPHDVLRLLAYLFMVEDGLAAYFSMAKMKTVGDAYMAVAGLPDSAQQTSSKAVASAQKLQAYRAVSLSCLLQLLFSGLYTHFPERTRFFREFRQSGAGGEEARRDDGVLGNGAGTFGEGVPGSDNGHSAKALSRGGGGSGASGGGDSGGNGGDASRQWGTPLPLPLIRIGVHTGPATVGVIDIGRIAHFDCYGASVALACRMEATAAQGRVQLTATARQQLAEVDVERIFEFEPSQKKLVKGFGTLTTFTVKSTKMEVPPEIRDWLQFESTVLQKTYGAQSGKHAGDVDSDRASEASVDAPSKGSSIASEDDVERQVSAFGTLDTLLSGLSAIH